MVDGAAGELRELTQVLEAAPALLAFAACIGEPRYAHAIARHALAPRRAHLDDATDNLVPGVMG
jgi:hypothetical protein